MGLRERKKQLTRQGILDAAERLFDEQGFDGTTVVQIADAANVSVKTLFTYFDSKEDLVFGGEGATRDALVAAVRERPAGTSALDAVRGFVDAMVDDYDRVHGLEGFHRTIGDSPALQARVLVTFDRFETALAEVLAAEAGASAVDPASRLAAAQLVLLLRILTTQEVRDLVARHPLSKQQEILRTWVGRAADALAEGLATHPAREPGDIRIQSDTPSP
ncbi:TetR/AcrR family transcriptional regulator [Streptomyces sp. NPDC051554]|uniref:TetR/AcrR family transcriptional regulator n=1 Tax=Streptomyces sp. NPDC051554 TaxID=3365656 RepID=UPI0037ACFD99